MEPLINMPIVRIELQNFRQSILHAFLKHSNTLNRLVHSALESEITEEKVNAIMQKEVESVLREVINKELINFFRYGDGLPLIKAKIQKLIEDHYASDVS